VAGDSLNEVQAQLVTHFLAQDVQAKILGIHAPLIGPNQYWPTDQLREGWVKRNGRRFPIVAMGNPNEHSTEFPAGDQPAHGTIKLWRFWLLQQLRDRRVSLVLSGHLHRRAMFMIANPQKAKPHQDLRDGMALCLIESELNRFWYDHGPPLFVNTTCAGPIGHNVPFAGGPEVSGAARIQRDSDGERRPGDRDQGKVRGSCAAGGTGSGPMTGDFEQLLKNFSRKYLAGNGLLCASLGAALKGRSFVQVQAGS